jgi:alpha-2-macroglobulin
MTGLVRAAILCATLALGLVTAQAADKAFKRDDLNFSNQQKQFFN